MDLWIALLAGAAAVVFGYFLRPLRVLIVIATAVVAIVDRVRHRRYNKTVQRTKKLFVHDSENDLNVGDRVRIQETRPLSKKKRWRIVEILERAR